MGATELTVVIEKMDPKASQCEWEGAGNSTAVGPEIATFELAAAAVDGVTVLQLWRSDLKSQDPADWFVQNGTVAVTAGGKFVLALEPNCLYTATTVTTGRKGADYTIPADTGFYAHIKPPYTDTFDGCNLSAEAAFFSDMAGSWEIVDSGNASHGKVMEQMVPVPPVFGIRSEVRPISLIGEQSFAATKIGIDVKLPSAAASAYVGAHFRGLTDGPGVFLRVHSQGWDLATQVADIGTKPDISGSNVTAAPGVWHRLELSVLPGGATGTLDGAVLFANHTAAASSGWAVIGTGGYDAGVQFDNLQLNATEQTGPSPGPSPGPRPPAPPAPPGPGPPPGPCKPPHTGQQVYNLPCSIGAEYVSWEGVGSGLISLKSAGSLCLGVDGDQSAVLVECSTEYQWSYSGVDSKLRPQAGPGKCLDINMHTAPMKAALWACNDNYNGGMNEKFVSDFFVIFRVPRVPAFLAAFSPPSALITGSSTACQSAHVNCHAELPSSGVRRRVRPARQQHAEPGTRRPRVLSGMHLSGESSRRRRQ